MIWFRPFCGRDEQRPDWEIVVRSEPETDVPECIAEDENGVIYDINGCRSWASLVQMTHDLRIEVISSETDPGS